ncbi:uncharacterized protein I303_103875 [Kwoniella dejecticola CBS 10117]|uniref:DNA-directed RNA polymerase I subunit RPA49 n=1 Tax=Kwoniella dejecticola CBS 10117 TaxID=1296121 RepID=A0A1A6A7Y9_9TREE|nr:uncharacterized protein I303_03894 [Kwoniella dejecticola CBS 10117]OBR86174.1 hypothetical protein I303_03894 [Kwoniella dejecticola CBS 10117]
MASSSQTTKKPSKRKSEAGSLGHSDVQVIVEEASTSAGPAFVNFPSVRPSKNTPFTIYTRDVGSSSDLTKQHSIIAGETEDVEFFSTNRDHNLNTEGADCQYLPALYDPSTGQVHIHPSTPLYLLTHGVKRLRASVNAPLLDKQAHWKAQRNDLGETFGTRKAKTQIRAEERNKVDVGAMQGVKGHLMGSIPELAMNDGPILANESIPTPNVTTSDPSEVYPRDSLISSQEWSSIDVKSLQQADDDETRQKALPWRRKVGWIQGRIRYFNSLEDKTIRRTQLRYVFYLSTLCLLRENAAVLSKVPVAELSSKFPGVPSQLLDGIIKRFAEPKEKRYVITEKLHVKLLAWICVLYLHVGGFSVDTGRVAQDLKLDKAKVENMFKNLGCRVDMDTPAEREKKGITTAEASANRKAVLKAPVVFPKQKTRGPAKR